MSTDTMLNAFSKYREYLGFELANKIEFNIGFHLLDLSITNGLQALIEKDVKKVLSQEEIDKIKSTILKMDFEGDELNSFLPRELIDKLFFPLDHYFINKKKPYLRVIECKVSYIKERENDSD